MTIAHLDPHGTGVTDRYPVVLMELISRAFRSPMAPLCFRPFHPPFSLSFSFLLFPSRILAPVLFAAVPSVPVLGRTVSFPLRGSVILIWIRSSVYFDGPPDRGWSSMSGSASGPTNAEPLVLIVEDEPDLAELYAAWLQEHCDIRTAYDGEGALEQIDDDVDIVLLDRRMPGLSGDEVLGTIRAREVDCRVAMVTAVEPDFDIVELGFDDYLVKPVSGDELLDTVDQLLLRSTYDEQLQELFALASKKALLKSQKTEAELRASQEYARLEDRLAVLRAQIDDTVAELIDHDAYRRICRDISPSSYG